MDKARPSRVSYGPMKCVVTAGPTFEPLDEVRRLTNTSTGKLGAELANHLVKAGHEVTLLLGAGSTFRGRLRAGRVLSFTTAADLRAHLATLAGPAVQAVFHAAAVSDFGFGRAFERQARGVLVERKHRKLPTSVPDLLVELRPTCKVIAELRGWFSRALLVGWKFEAEGDRASVVRNALAQISRNRTDACVANGPAYGQGFGLVTAREMPQHWPDAPALYRALDRLLAARRGERDSPV
jgi:phosphopantothenate---cysteine ligase (CTP)